MTLPVASNSISLSQVNVELGFGSTATISLNDTAVRGLFGIASGAISMSDGWGKSASVPGAGYFGGGLSGPEPTYYAEIDGINFSTEAAINPSATLAAARRFGAGASSSTKGYFAGGDNVFGNRLTEIDGINFSTEAAINPAAALAVARLALTGVNSSTKGYFAGGMSFLDGSTNVYDGVSTYDTPLNSNEIDGINFSTEAAINPSATLAARREELAGASSSTKGYFCGGIDAAYHRSDRNPYSNEIDGIDFSTEAAVNPAATLVAPRRGLAGASSSTKGYFGGGATGYTSFTYLSIIVYLNFSTESSANTSASVAVQRDHPGGVNSSSKGYFGGGLGAGPSWSSEIDGINFSTEAAVNPSATLISGRYSPMGVSYR